MFFPLAQFAMNSPTKAIITTLLLTLAGLWVTPFGILASGILVLIYTKDPSTGHKALLAASLLAIAMGTWALQSISFGLVFIGEFLIVPAIMAWVFDRSANFSLGAEIGAWIALLAAFILFISVDNPTQWWVHLLEQMTQSLHDQMDNQSQEQLKQMIGQVAPAMMIILAMALMTIWYLGYFVGTYWSSKLYAPGKFREKFVAIRFSKWIFYAAILGTLFSLWQDQHLASFGAVVGFIGIFALMIQGLAVVHYQAGRNQLPNFYLITLYVLLGIIPQVMLVVSLIGTWDMWLNLRKEKVK